MGRSRLDELKSAAKEKGVADPTESVDIGFEHQSAQESDPFMEDFFHKVKEIRQNMDKIETLKAEISEKHEHVLTLVSQKDAQRESSQLDDLMQNVQVLGNRIRNSLKQIDKATKTELKAQQLEGVTGKSADLRIRENHHNVLSRKFLNIMKEYNEQQTAHKQKYRERVERQFKIVKPNASEEEVAAVLGGESHVDIFANQITMSTKEEQQLLEDIEDRHKDILKLEKSIRELHELFMDMAILVEMQGEMIDRIDNNVSEATVYVGEAKKELKVAQAYQTSARKKQLCCVVLLAILILIIVIPLISKK